MRVRMEHLPVPNGKASQLSHTVLFLNDKPYDGGPFLTYPERDGWPQEFVRALRSSDSMELLRYHMSYPPPHKKYESFLQRWLFFGLLTELLGNTFRSFDFVSGPPLQSETLEGQHDTRRFLTTDKLAPLVMSWMERLRNGQVTCSYSHVAACLQVAFRALLATGSDFDASLKTCLASVCEAVGFAVTIAFDIEDLAINNQCPGSWTSASGQSHWASKFQGSSWCPYQIRIILESAMTIQTLHFMALIAEEDGTQSHESCNQDKCVTSQVDLASYKTQHCTSECQCDFIEVDSTVMQSILQSGSYPVLRIKKDNNSTNVGVELIASSPEIPFTVLSHVWADGLGNPRANGLPQCQLAALHEWICQLLGPASTVDHAREIFLWCDTMCCPRRPIEARRMAISCMHRPYQEASHVLVLDKYIRAFPLQGMHFDEVYIRILISNWNKRMWTLQEGALPIMHGQVRFQFLDGCISMDDLMNHARESVWRDPFRHGLTLDMFTHFREIRSKRTRDLVPAITRMGLIFKTRKVSYAHDEPLLLGMMLDLDVRHILNGPDETRMQRMWSLMPAAHGGIPDGIIFRGGRRLDAQGFRWAPATFLEGNESLDLMMGPVRLMKNGIPTHRGLLVSVSGYKIERVRPPLKSSPWGLAQEAAGPVLLRGADRWYLVVSTGDDHLSPTSLIQLTLEERSLYVLHPQDKLQPEDDEAQGATRALLVELNSQEQEDGTKYVRSLRHLALGRLPRPRCHLYEIAHRCASQLTASDPGQRYLQSDSNPEGADSATGQDLATELRRLVTELEDDVVESARSYPEQNIRLLMESEAASLFSKGYMSIGRRSAEAQQWCVD